MEKDRQKIRVTSADFIQEMWEEYDKKESGLLTDDEDYEEDE